MIALFLVNIYRNAFSLCTTTFVDVKFEYAPPPPAYTDCFLIEDCFFGMIHLSSNYHFPLFNINPNQITSCDVTFNSVTFYNISALSALSGIFNGYGTINLYRVCIFDSVIAANAFEIGALSGISKNFINETTISNTSSREQSANFNIFSLSDFEIYFSNINISNTKDNGMIPLLFTYCSDIHISFATFLMVKCQNLLRTLLSDSINIENTNFAENEMTSSFFFSPDKTLLDNCYFKENIYTNLFSVSPKSCTFNKCIFSSSKIQEQIITYLNCVFNTQSVQTLDILGQNKGNDLCVEIKSTKAFTQSNNFVESSIFSFSNTFLEKNTIFTPSSIFTASNKFTPSFPFRTKSNERTKFGLIYANVNGKNREDQPFITKVGAIGSAINFVLILAALIFYAIYIKAKLTEMKNDENISFSMSESYDYDDYSDQTKTNKEYSESYCLVYSYSYTYSFSYETEVTEREFNNLFK